MSVNSKMTALADEVRTLSGTTAKLGIDAMTTNVQNANSEVENQTTLLAQAIAALEGKTAGGGSAAPVLQNKTVTPAASSQTVTPDSGYDGLARVTVNAIPSNYEDVAEETEAYTDSLTELESVINSLPDAGGSGDSGSGGESEECFFLVHDFSFICATWCDDPYEGAAIIKDSFSNTGSIFGTVLKNSIITVFCDTAISFSCTGAEIVNQYDFNIGTHYYVYMFRITGAEADITGE